MQTTATEAAACQTCGSLLDAQSFCLRCGYHRRGPSLPTNSFLLRVNLTGLLIASLVAVAVFTYQDVRLVRSGAYNLALQRALSSAEVQKILGSVIRVKYPALGYLSLFGEQQFAEWSQALSGPRGSGHLYGVANRVRGTWEFSRLVFEAENKKERVDLTPIHRLRLPSVPAKSVYLVPIGLADGQSLQWATAYYKSKLGIELTELPPIPLDPKIIDAARNQLNADKCFDFFEEKYPEIARDPSSILIGVTSRDMYLPGFKWSHYAENARSEGRFAIISSARLHPPSLLGKWNPEWLTSRLQKLLTKNIVMLYFNLPMSSDYTSLLSGGVLTGAEIDRMGGEIIGEEGHWDSFVESGDPASTIYDGPGDKQLWKMAYTQSALPDTNSQVFSMDLGVGLIVQRKADFVFPEEKALQFTRIYRNADDRSRSFGIGGSNSFDIFLGGQMGVAVDLIMEDGARIHFNHQQPQAGQSGDTYLAGWGGEGRFENAKAIYLGGSWQVKTTDGWTYIFPYRPQALPQNVTVLTNFIDPAGNEYRMERDSYGSLISIESPTGKALHFENDPQHRIRKITSSEGRSVQYDYDVGGRMVRAADSEGRVDTYSYDDRAQMITASHGTGKPILTNEYFTNGYLKNQTMSDGRKFGYAYFSRERGVIYENQITDPNGLETYIQYVPGGYIQSLPAPVPH
jgi:YD repeat-containing protein